jgi:hypothetical protein
MYTTIMPSWPPTWHFFSPITSVSVFRAEHCEGVPQGPVDYLLYEFCHVSITTHAAGCCGYCRFPLTSLAMVSAQIIEKLSIKAPSGEVKLQMLKDIAAEHNFEWDSTKTETILMEPKQDLLVRRPLFLFF